MNKMKKLLSVILAMVMMLSCFTVLGHAFQEYEIEDGDYWYYDSNDNPRVYLYSAEQRASIAMDTVDELLGSLGLIFVVDIKISKITLNLSSYDKLCETLDNGLISMALNLGGDIADLEHGMLDGNTRAGDGDVASLNNLLYFAQKNADVIYNIINGGIDLGTIGSVAGLDLSGINKILTDIPGMLGGLLYGLSDRQMTNGIGEDPNYKNSALWDDITTDERNSNADYKLDTLVTNLVLNLLTTPRNTVRITDRSQNTLGAQALEEVLEDGTKNYYCYGTETAEDGTVTLVTTYEGEEPERIYLTRWDESSALLKGKSAEDFKAAFDLYDKDVYTLLEDIIGWAYDAFAGHNLDGQLRATLMQFCGAYNNGAESEYLNDEIKAELKAKMDAYKEIEKNANLDKTALQTEFKNTVGAAGNVNFMYFNLDGKSLNDTTSDATYYVVEWDGNYQYYHVEYNDLSTFFDLIDWEYQAPSWAELTAQIGWTKGTSLLQHINDIVGTIITTAVNRTAEDVEVTTWNADGSDTVTTTEDLSLTWTSGTADGALAANVTKLIKLILKADTRKLFGSTYHLPYGFDNLDLEGVVVELADLLVPRLMPALVLPEGVSSVEEIGAYALREYMAEILPDTGAEWDAALAAANTEDEYLDVLLSMGTSVGIYYLTNLIGLGTKTDGANNTTTSNYIDYLGTTYTWQVKLDYIVDWVVTTFAPNLTKNSGFTTDGTDGLASLSKILSTLAPSLVKVLGANTDSYALDLNHVYDDLRLILDGDFSEVGKGLLRKDSGTSGNVPAIQAIGTFLTELFGGLGMNVSGSDWAGDWSTLSGKFTTAYAAEYPLQTLLGDYGTSSTIASFAQYFVSTLTYCRDYWFSDALVFILMIAGRESALKNNGVAIAGTEAAYTGSATATVDFSFVMNAAGVREFFNDGRYKTGNSYMDGDFALKVVDAEVVDAKGNVKGSTSINAVLAPNEKAYYSVAVSNIQEDPEVYTLKIEYQVKNPADADFSNADTVYAEVNFIASSLLNDSLSYTTGTYSAAYDGSNHTSASFDTDGSTKTSKDSVKTYLEPKLTYGYTNTYVSEKEQLSKVADTVFYLWDQSTEYLTNDNASKLNYDYAGKLGSTKHTFSKVYVNGYGYNTKNDDGSITITDHTTDNFTVTQDGAAVDANSVWFKWNVNDSDLNNGNAKTSAAFGVAHDTRTEVPMWTYETTAGLVRANYEEEYISYKVAANLSFDAVWGDLGNADEVPYWEGDMTTTASNAASIAAYVTLYNSYDLENRINNNLGLKAENYPEAGDAWTEYENAVAYANRQMYGQWIASSFEADHTIAVSSITIPVDADGVKYEGYDEANVSTFKYAGDRLEAAVAALAEYYVEIDDTEASEAATIIDPSDAKSPYYAAYTALKEMQAADTSNHNYLLYTWYRYNDAYQALKNALNALSVPDATAPNTLVGVFGDNEQIDKTIAAINNDGLEAVVSAMVQAPTEDAVKAAADAYAAFEENYETLVKTYDPAVLAADAATMTIYGTSNATVSDSKTGRLLPKYSEQKMYFLNDAVTNYGNEKAADYSEGSYAVYAEKLAEAKAVQADKTATQYEIFSARYELLVAYKALIPAGDEINVTTNGASGTEEDGLKALYAQAEALFAAISDSEVACTVDMNDDGVIDETDDALAYEQLVWAAGVPVTTTDEYDQEVTYYIGGEYTGAYALSQEGKLLSIKKQGWINEITARMDAAIANFEATALPELMLSEYGAEIGAVISTTYGVTDGFDGAVYGIDTLGVYEMVALSDCLTTPAGYININTDASSGAETTGTVIELYDDDDNLVASYVFIYFGDVDMDGMVSSGDGTMIIDYELTLDGLYTEYELMAADVDGDGMPSSGDGTILIDYELSLDPAYANYMTQAEIAACYQ